jgi:hypothetical protein
VGLFLFPGHHTGNSKNLNIKIYKTIIFLVVSYGCKTWSLTVWEEHRLMVFENRVLRRIFRCKRENGEDCIMRSFVIFSLHQILLG